ncbi:hypothetical protein HH214_04255 [Mucilaginibacter robiniae]|uniref:Uncharacterized protein n=1 Tax=Mucilaginibacter robiniae TaxID=2728022 RepID=A0A7L5DVL6_9SPHI|nr:hypothetical protein [Mucilaginibacter robiniae]QJD95145.1 hypothetical protein HH214_04255 [Mucilaginibacter robiniae]
MIKLNTKTRNELWWLIISVDYNYGRIAIADHELNGQHLILWLEDKQDYKNTLDECLQLHIPVKQFAKFIKSKKFNSYKGARMHPQKKYVYTAEISISEPLPWYQQDATPTEQRWAREALLKHILTQLVENELYDCDLDF